MYNKLESLREKGVAEKLIVSNDYVSARDRLLKAKQLFPSLDHIVPMLTVCDILSASKSKIPGYGTDHYWVLQLLPSCSQSDIKYRCEKLVTLLQPIKNKFPGTESALKLIQEASLVLSDRNKRLTFDSTRGSSWADYESSCFQRVSSGQSGSNEAGFPKLGPKLLADHNIAKHVDTTLRETSSFSSDLNSEAHSGEDRSTILDVMDSPSELQHTSSKGDPSKVEVPKMRDQDFYNFESNRAVEYFETGQIWAVHHRLDEPKNYRYAQINALSQSAASVTWLKPVPVTEGERRWCSAGLPVACGPFWLDLELGEELNWPMAFSYNCSWVPGVAQEQFEIYPKKDEVWAVYNDWDLDEWSYNPQMVKGKNFKLVEFLSDFSKYLGAECASLVKVDGFKSVFERQTEEGDPVILHISPSNLYMLSHNVPAYRFTGGEIDGVVSGMFELDQLALRNETREDTDSQTMPKDENSESSRFTIDQHTSSTPYSRRTTLGPNWSPNDFATGQVWAVYWGKDLMPRQYARVDNVIRGRQVCVTFLEPQPNFDFKVNLKGNLDIVCGIFEANETTVNLEMWQFSHPVKCQQSTSRPVYKIFPRRGEIWAMYQNWNSECNDTSYENCECCIVEILSDLLEGEKMMVAKLEEVKGCLTFFHRQQLDGFDMARALSKNEMLSFSHQIPAFRVPGIGQHGIPENSWHLEPNALPPNHGK
ncbi:hypothetical protein LguiA_009755 [Lonicera macranthoides]